MSMIDVFLGDAFSLTQLTDALNRLPYQPQYLGSLGIFQPKPIRTLKAAFEKKDKVLSLVQTSARGAPLEQRGYEKSDIRDFATVRLAKASHLNADELQSVRAFGSESEFKQVQDEVLDRMMDVRTDLELTLENMRLGAVQGIVTDADGSTLYNWFSEWSITPPTEIDFDLDNASPASGAVRQLCNDVVRGMARASKGGWLPGTQVYGLCGDAFFDALTKHVEIRQTYLNTSAAQDLSTTVGNPFGAFKYGQITWVNYRGTDDNSTVAVPTDKVKFFPVGAPGVFQHVMSPGEGLDLVNTQGQPMYARTIMDKDRNAWVDIEVSTYPLMICTRPEMLFSGRRT